MPTIDNLDIEISASAKSADTALNNLVNKLGKVQTAISNLNVSNFSGFAVGVKNVSNAMQGLSNVKMPDYTRLAKGITRLSQIDTATIRSAGGAIGELAKSLRVLDNVQMSDNAKQLTELASAVKQLGYKSATQAVENIPKLAVAMEQLMQTLSRAPQVSRNLIDMTNALAALARTGSTGGRAANALGTNLLSYNRATQRSTRSTLSLAAAFGKFYATYWLVIRGIKGLYNSIESTADYIEAFNFYNVAFNKVASEWSQDFKKYGYENAESYANSFTERMSDTLSKLSGVQVEVNAEGKGLLSETGLKNLGLNIREVTEYAAQLASVTNSIGLTGEASLAAANSLTKLAGDISSLFNIDYSTAAENLQSGLIGQSRALYKYGIDITNATLQTYAYNLSLSKAVSEMTQAEKMQLRMLAILDQSKVAWGDLANTINNPSNAIRVFKNQMSELSQMIGQLFIPVLSKIMPILTGIAIAIKRLVASIAGFFGIQLNFDSYAQGFSDIDTGVEDVSDGLDKVANSAKKARAGLRAFDELKTISMPNTSGGGGGVGGGGAIDLTDELLAATAEYEKAWQEAYDRMRSVAEEWANRIEKVLEPVREFFRNLINGNWAAAGKNFSDIISGIFNALANAIAKVDWEYVGTAIGEFIRGIKWTDIFASIGKFIWEGINAGIDIYKGIFNAAPIETTLFTGLALLKFTPLGKLIGAKIVSAIAKHLTFGKIGEVLLAGIKVIFGSKAASSALAFMDKFTVMFTGITSIIGGMTIAGANFFDMWKNGWNLFNEILKDVGIALAAIGAVVLGVPAAITVAIAAAVASVSSAVVVIKNNWGTLTEVFTIDNWVEGVKTNFKQLSNALDTVKNSFNSMVDNWKNGWTTIVEWNQTKFEEFQTNWINGWNTIKSDVLTAWSGIKANWISGWSAIVDWWNGNAISKWWSESVAPWFTKEKWTNAMSGVGEAFRNVWNSAVASIKEIWNKFATWLNSKLKFDIGPINIGGKQILESKTINLGKIPTFQTGGFPESASLFFAGENGIPEIVGSVGGRTAVASGTEITGIADAVYSTGQTEASLLQTAVGLLEVIAEKEYGISSDAVFKSVRNSAKNYSRRTGRLAFDF